MCLNLSMMLSKVQNIVGVGIRIVLELGVGLQSGWGKYKTSVVCFLVCMTYHADITLTCFCICNDLVTPILKMFVFLSRYAN